jgi:phosphotransferase family enzyme
MVIEEPVLAPIAAHLAQWETAHVELAIYGTADARDIARALDDFCLRELGCAPDATLFYRSSVGAVAGLRLRDGRKIVIKGHQPDHSRRRLEETARLQTMVTHKLGLAPRIMAGPTALGSGFAVVEAYEDRGSVRDGHDPAVRRALAGSLYAVTRHLTASTALSAPLPNFLTSAPANSLWPRPHSKLFDFEATRNGAEYIDALAATARAHMNPAGRKVIGHGDWRAEHVRFDGEEIVIAFDWDSLCEEREPALVGITAHMFCADWSRDDIAQAPAFEEARAFVTDYESAAGRHFAPDERELCGAAFAYSVAYSSRCAHACGVDTRGEPGTYQHLLSSRGEGLLALCAG